MTRVVWPQRLAVRETFGEVVTVNVQDRAEADIPADPPVTRIARVIMAGGGTGGHLYPGLAVAAALQQVGRARGIGFETHWAATPRAVDQRLLGQFGERYVQQKVQPLTRQITRLWGFWNGWETSCQHWKRFFKHNHVDAVLALGGYAAGPAAYVAAKFGVPVGLLNPDALPGLANRFLLKRSDVVFTQWALPAEMAKSIRGKVMPLGCPIREGLVGRSREAGAARLGFDAGRPLLVVTGGSLAARNINDAMKLLMADAEVLAAFTGGGWQLLHLTGTEQLADVKAAYEPITSDAIQVRDYCDDMASVWAVADLAIARAGASTCAELTACGVPSVLLPYPYHRDDHQRHNAQHLVDAGGAVIITDTKDAAANAAGIKKELISLLYEQPRRASMAAAARQSGKPHAARDIALEMLKLMSI